MADEAEGKIDDTGDQNNFVQWLSKWDFSDPSKLQSTLKQQGIKNANDLKKYVENESAFNKLASRLNINFVDEMCLEKAWKSLHPNIDEKKVVFLGANERKIMDELYKKYDTVSNDIDNLQKHFTQLRQSAVNAKKQINNNFDAMVQIIEQNRTKITNEIENERIQRENDINDILKKLTIVRKIYSKKKAEFEKIALNNDTNSTQKLKKFESLLTINKNEYDIQSMNNDYNDDEKGQNDDVALDLNVLVLIGIITVPQMDQDSFSNTVYSLQKMQKTMQQYTYKWNCAGTYSEDNIYFSADYGHKDRFTLTDNKKNVTTANGTVLCDKGWNEGVHSWQMKWDCDTDPQRRIGIFNTQNHKFCGHACTNTGGLSYMWRAGSHYHGGDIYVCKDGKKVSNTVIGKIWTKGGIAKVVLDCNRWNVEFFHNGESVAKMDIEKNQTYYPVIHGCPKMLFVIV